MAFSPRQRRAKLAKRDGWCCHYCKAALADHTATIDHVVPRALGGSGSLHNLRLACFHCNQAKGSKPPHVFHALMMQGLVA